MRHGSKFGLLFLSIYLPDMTDGTLGSEDESKDIESSQVGASESKGSWLTSRRELWSFYLYYVVRIVFSACHSSFSITHQGKQWFLRLLHWPIPVPKLDQPCG